MENVAIEGISNLNVVTNLFSQVGCVEADNCILVTTNRDFVGGSNPGNMLTTNATIAGAKNGGLVGGLVAGAVAGAINTSVQNQVNEFHSTLDARQKIAFDRSTYAGFLINVLSTGIGVIPLRNSGQIVPKVKDLITDVEHFFFINYNELEDKQLKKLPLNFSSMQFAMCFKNTGKLKVYTPWQLPKKHKLIPYQEANFNKLAARF
ncbi:MAG: hypothetical protein J6O17_02310 [Eubacterium sp.]|nr:hypothetical protein [Eubacterium sp.]